MAVFCSSAQVAQSVEQRTENPRVDGSIPPLGTMNSRSSNLVGAFFVSESFYVNILIFQLYAGHYFTPYCHCNGAGF